MNVKLLTEYHLEFLSPRGGCTGLSESILVKMPHMLEITCHGSIIIVYQNVSPNQISLSCTHLTLCILVTPKCNVVGCTLLSLRCVFKVLLEFLSLTNFSNNFHNFIILLNLPELN